LTCKKMFRSVAQRFSNTVCNAAKSHSNRTVFAVTSIRGGHGGPVESDEAFDARYEAYFNRQDIDGWEVRKAMNDLQGMDMVPEPKIISAAMRACRRVDDYALAVRYLEAVQNKCGGQKDKIWPYLLSEIQPTLDELGILTPEQMGYDKPELALEDVYDMH